MRVLLDECMPRKLKRETPGHYVRTVTEAGWGWHKEWRALTPGGRRVRCDAYANLEHQQNTAALPISVIVLIAAKNDADILRPLMARVRELLTELQPGRLYHVPAA